MHDKPLVPSALIAAKSIRLIKGGQPLLLDLSLSIQAGKTSVIMGHNGAGKTLLLCALHGLEAIQSGTITSARAISQKMVFQRPILLRRTAAAHFQFVSGITDHTAISGWFENAGIADKMTTSARHLSSGEAQKLALISALASAPDCLFLDEPTANLDSESRADVERLLAAAKADGTTLVMVTHAYAQAKRLADQIIFMQKGQICDDVPAADFIAGKRSAKASAFLSDL